MKYAKELNEILNTITKDFYLLKGFTNIERTKSNVVGLFAYSIIQNHREELKIEYGEKHNLINNNFNDFNEYLNKMGLVFTSEIFEKVKTILGREFYDFINQDFEGEYITTPKLHTFLLEQEKEIFEELERFIETEYKTQTELLKGLETYNLNIELNYQDFNNIKAFYINENYYQLLETEHGKTLEFIGREHIRKTNNPQDYIFNLIDIKLNDEDIKKFNLSRGLNEKDFCFFDTELKFKTLSYSSFSKEGNLRFKKEWFYKMRYNPTTKEFFTHYNQLINFNNLLTGASEKTKKDFWEIINHAKELIERGLK